MCGWRRSPSTRPTPYIPARRCASQLRGRDRNVHTHQQPKQQGADEVKQYNQIAAYNVRKANSRLTMQLAGIHCQILPLMYLCMANANALSG